MQMDLCCCVCSLWYSYVCHSQYDYLLLTIETPLWHRGRLHPTCNRDIAVGSNPTSGSHMAWIAQLVERRIVVPQVAGSSPAPRPASPM